MELRYCIYHEEMVETECEPICGHTETVPFYDDNGHPNWFLAEIDFCEFPLGYAFVERPEVEPLYDWMEFHKDEPYREDLLEFHAETAQAEAELLVELITQEV